MSPLPVDPDSRDNNYNENGNLQRAFLYCSLLAMSSLLTSLLPFLDMLFMKWRLPYRFANNQRCHAWMYFFGAGVLLYLSLCDLLPDAIDSLSNSKLFSPQNTKRISSFLFILPASLKIIPLLCRSLKSFKKTSPARSSKYDGSATPPLIIEKQRTTVISDLASSQEMLYLKRQNMLQNDLDQDQQGESSDDRAPSLLTSQRSARHRELASLSRQVAVGIALHNLPEGFATFLMVANDPNSLHSALFCVGLFLHKLPEGIIVALPIWMESGSKIKGVLMAGLAGTVSFLSGATLGFLIHIFQNEWMLGNGFLQGIIFSTVAGFLGNIALSGMIPLAFQCDVSGSPQHYAAFLGIGVFIILNSFLS